MKIEIVKMKIALQQERAEREDLEGEFVCIVEQPQKFQAFRVRAIFGSSEDAQSYADAQLMLRVLRAA